MSTNNNTRMHIGRLLSTAGSRVSNIGIIENVGNCRTPVVGNAAVKSSVDEKIAAPI